jgi:hypothetical protein
MRKKEWPAYIASALGIPTVNGSGGPWISTGDTTDVSWFRAMSDYLGIAYEGERIRSMQAILEEVGGAWDLDSMSSGGAGKQSGGNVRIEAFEALWQRLEDGGYLPADADDPDAFVNDTFSNADDALPELTYVLRTILRRRGQPAFRQRLLEAYDRKCAITGCALDAVLEAAHIRAHADGGSMHVRNGLVLRSDLHTLFDLRQIAVNTEAWTIEAHDSVRAAYDWLHGATFHRPRNEADCPSSRQLDAHRKASGL